jgi:hypothetical protein
MRKTPKSTDLAKRYKCHVKTIQGWKREGAPLHSPKKMRGWLAGRKNLPPRLPLGHEGSDSAPAFQIPAAIAERVGAPAALDRVQRAEVASFTRLCLAQASPRPDPVLTRRCREEWLRILEALRSYEKCITADRRAIGELVEKAQVETDLALLGQALRMSAKAALPSLAHELLNACDLIRVRQLVERANWYCFIGSLAVGYAAKIPQWILDAYAKDICGALSKGETTIHADAAKLGEYLEQLGLGLAVAAIRDTPPVPPEAKPPTQPANPAPDAGQPQTL